MAANWPAADLTAIAVAGPSAFTTGFCAASLIPSVAGSAQTGGSCLLTARFTGLSPAKYRRLA